MHATINARPTPQGKFSSHKTNAETRHEGRGASSGTSSGELILIRGLPGSGKSTMARTLASKGFHHFEADMYFEVNGHYQYDASRIQDAHSWCQTMTRQALAAGKRVVVSNTFTQLREMTPYFSMTKNAQVIEATGNWQNVHGVPAAMLKQMAQRWERLPVPGLASLTQANSIATENNPQALKCHFAPWFKGLRTAGTNRQFMG